MNLYIKLVKDSRQNPYSKERKLKLLEREFAKNPLLKKSLGDIYRKNYYRTNNPKMRVKALKAYRDYLEVAKSLNIQVDKEILDFIDSNGLKKVKSSWGDYLISDKAQIPTGKFKAVYFDSREPKKIIFSEVVDRVAINYIYDQFHKIDSGHFGGYWVGYLEFDRDEKMAINLSFSNSKIRVIVDGYEVYKGRRGGVIPFNFSKGKHKIEIEYLNGWHTTELNVKIFPFIEFLTINEIKEKLDKIDMKNVDFWYVGVYESRAKDSSITLKIKKSQKPVILLLQSYSAVNWKIENPKKTNIKRVVLNSSSPIATVEGVDASKVIYSKDMVGYGYRMKPNCSCVNGMFHCEGGTFKGYAPVPKRFNKKIKGFSGKYSTKSLVVPEIEIDSARWQRIKEQEKRLKKLRAECTKNRNIDMESLFK